MICQHSIWVLSCDRMVCLHPSIRLQYDSTFIERGPGPVNIARPTPLQFHFPIGGPATRTGPSTLSVKVEYLQGAPPLLKPLTCTKLHTQVLGSLHSGGLVCPRQWLLLAVFEHLPPWCEQGFSAIWGKG